MAGKYAWEICLVFVLLFFTESETTLQTTVNYTLGTLIGLVDNVTDGTQQYTVAKFLGIPYAKPPVGDLRLRKPEPLEKLDNDPYNATYFRSYCVQGQQVIWTTGVEDEDCLYLNVYVPMKDADRDTGHAVMVWVHGGGFVTGLSNLFDGFYLAAVGNVIVVTLNYRLGLFGFLTTMDSDAPGNYGLFDQAMAFKWVHDNIAAFGGDSNRVTIFGESAGAMSVSFHSLYPVNRGRFQRVLAQSGAAGIPIFNLDGRESAVRLAEAVSCSSDNTSGMLECLRTKPWDVLKSSALKLIVPFVPTVDNDIIPIDYKYLKDRSSEIPDNIAFFQSLDFMSGVNKYDGVITFVENVNGSDLNTFEPTNDDILYNHLVTFGHLVYQKELSEAVRRTIFHEYTDWTAPSSYESNRLKLMELYTDFYFGVPSVDMLRHHVGNNSTKKAYSYLFTQVTTIRMAWTPSWLDGADHVEEVRLVFGIAFQYMPDFEKTLSTQIMTYWSNFAKSGNPNQPVSIPAIWPMYNMSDQAYIELKYNLSDTSKKQFRAARATHFWLDVVPGLLHNETGTVPDASQNCVSGAEKFSATFFSVCFMLMAPITGILSRPSYEYN